jgi:hypothetical protein
VKDESHKVFLFTVGDLNNQSLLVKMKKVPSMALVLVGMGSLALFSLYCKVCYQRRNNYQGYHNGRG